jgi:NAD(P)H-quinone oxidoreductase subunit 5
MQSLFTCATVTLVAAPAVASLLYALNRDISAKTMGRVTVAGGGVMLVSALVLLYGVFRQGFVDEVFAVVGDPKGFHFYVGAWIDRLSILSVLLIAIIGLVVQRYSLRYLEGDPRQARFFAWLSFVLCAVTLFVVSRNLLALTLSWYLVSYGVHRLLLHFPEREAAQKAAWRKFVISRLGDVALLGALVLTYTTFGTFEFWDVFASAQSPEQWNAFHLLGTDWNPVALAGALYVVGAMTKSAQFPFHIWLPDTMETPTPVSALMHAGIINAGGFLIVRLSPIVSHALAAMDVLFVLGALTAMFGGLVFLVQTDTKRSLAYSTVAQMGYMMMQCGLGAFAAAVLHLVMHGFYKANAFLSAAANVSPKPLLFARKPAAPVTLAPRLWAMVVAALLVVASVAVLGIDVGAKAGGPFLVLFLWFTVVQALAPVLRPSVGWTARATVVAASFVGVSLYWVLLGGFATFLSPVFEAKGVADWTARVPDGVLWAMSLAFVLLYAATEVARSAPERAWAQRFYVLCLNHFYIEHGWRRVLGVVLGRTPLLPAFETTAIAPPLGERNERPPSREARGH